MMSVVSNSDACAHDGEQRLNRLLAPMLKKKLFVAINRSIASQEELKRHVVEHLDYMNKLEAEGTLFASGPFQEKGVIVGDGLTILRVESIAEAERLIQAEPLIRKGLRTYELREWELREGRMTITLNASTSSFDL